MDSTKDPLVVPRKFENLGLDQRECLDKIEDLVRKHRVEFERPPRPNAKLLVLDADCTLTCDDGKPRPYLQIMLSRVTEKYDIILWSHERDHLSSRLNSLNVFGSRYNIICYLNKKIKIEVNSNKYGTLCVKPLDFIWKNFPYDHRNTIMFDDKWQSYALNRQFGISTNRKDRSSNSENCELEAVANYLDIIAKLDDLSILHHNDWKDNLDRKSPQGIPFLPPARIAHDDWTIEDITSETTITFTVVASFGDNEESNRIASDLSITEESDRSDTCDGSEVSSAEESEVKTDSSSSDADESKEFEVKVALKQPFRDDKKLLILDFQILYDLRYTDHPCMLSARPYLREFLLRASENYDIAILTDRNIRFVEKGLRKFRIKKSGKCKISCIVEIVQDSVPERDVEYQRRICEAIWRGSGGYSDKNTVMAIDNSKHFHNSPLKVDIKSYTTKNIRMDIELGRLGAYLNQIASIEDFTTLNHSMWREPERVFKYLESGDWGRSSREIDVQIKFWEETVNLERCDKDTSIGAIKEIVSGRIGISAEHQIFWFDMSQDYVAFEIIERQSVDQTRLRSPVPQVLLLQCRGRYFEDNVQIHKWSTEDRILFAISCDSDLHIPQLPIDSVAERSILTWKMDSITPESINDYPPVVREIRPGTGWNHVYYSDGMEWLRDLSIEILNEPRPDKKLLILGGRFTLYASPLETDVWQKRPYLDDLLRRAYAYYDIAIWTDDGDEITRIMLENLGIMGDDKGYKIAFYLSNLWMFQMPSEFGTVNVKSLSIIWEKLPNYNEQNTIAVDSFDFFYLMHPKLLYQIDTYRLENSETDRELRNLARHLELIATSDEFCELRGRNLLGPARIIYRDTDGVVRAKNRTDLIIKWRDNELIIKDIHIETTAQELKHMLADILNIPVPEILLEEYNEDVRNN